MRLSGQKTHGHFFIASATFDFYFDRFLSPSITTASIMDLQQRCQSRWIGLAALAIIVLSFVPLVTYAINKPALVALRIEYEYYLASHGVYQYNCTIVDIRGPIVSFVLVESFCVRAWDQPVHPLYIDNFLQIGPSPCWTTEEYLCAPNSMSIVDDLGDTTNYIMMAHAMGFMFWMGWIGVITGGTILTIWTRSLPVNKPI
jgi:hypothetical protein